MRIAKPIIAAVALSMVAAPAFAQSAQPLSVATAVQDEGGAGDDSAILPAIAIAAILAAAILITSNEDSDLSNPVSP